MKKQLLALTLATLTTSSLFAATTATLLLKGTVAPVMSISLTAEPLAASLPLQTTQNASKVATVTEVSNSTSGYKITLSSAHNGKLRRTSGNEEFPYSLTYGTQGGINLNSQYVISNPQAAAVNVNKDVKISYTGVPAASMVAGEYTDTITFTIAAN